MSSIQQAREGLGQRCRELRRDAGLTGQALAAQLGWPQSKVSKIETGRQAPSEDDVHAWAVATGREEMRGDLLALVRTLETMYAEWRRQLRSGSRTRQHSIADLEGQSAAIRAFESTILPGLVQTPEYARALIGESIAFHGIPDDVDQAVRARMERQQVLYQPGTRVHMVVAEAALHHRVCDTEVLMGQLDRLVPLTTTRNVQFGIVPTEARYQFAPPHGFWIFDEELVLVETVTAELRLTQSQEIRDYRHVFDRLAASAVFGKAARDVITRALDLVASESP